MRSQPMKRIVLTPLWALVLLGVSKDSDAASISGRVNLRGVPPPEIPIQMTTDCAQAQTKPPATRHYVVDKDGGLANVLVVIRTGLEGKKFTPPTNVVTMECIACQSHPYVVAVQTGQPFLFRNDSPFQENLHFTSRMNHEWNFGLPANTSLAKTFDHAEEFFRIKGDAHPWFFGYLCVVDHPFFAVTGADG